MAAPGIKRVTTGQSGGEHIVLINKFVFFGNRKVYF